MAVMTNVTLFAGPDTSEDEYDKYNEWCKQHGTACVVFNQAGVITVDTRTMAYQPSTPLVHELVNTLGRLGKVQEVTRDANSSPDHVGIWFMVQFDVGTDEDTVASVLEDVLETLRIVQPVQA